jgi:hypothetical protein
VANGHGGARVGAGRKPGHASRRTREIANGALKEGITPLEFLLKVMRDETAPLPLRCEMAVAAMQYCHPRISTQVLPAELEPRGATTINVIAYPAGTSISRDGVVRLPPPAVDVDVIEGEATPVPEQSSRKPN